MSTLFKLVLLIFCGALFDACVLLLLNMLGVRFIGEKIQENDVFDDFKSLLWCIIYLPFNKKT